MNETIQSFEEGVKKQAIASGYSPDIASAIAAQAVLDRMNESDAGFAVAQTEEFVTDEVTEFQFNIESHVVSQSEDGAVLIDAVFCDTSVDLAGQSWAYSVFPTFADQINSGLIHGYVDEHGEFRTTLERDTSKSATEWVRARIENGKLYITTQLKKGYEWVADKFKFISAEAIVPKNKTVVSGRTKEYRGGTLKGFVFTNTPKNYDHKIKAVRK